MNDGRQDDERADSGLEEMYEDLPPYAPASSLDSSQLRRACMDSSSFASITFDR